MKYCRQCGQQLSDEACFCNLCGAAVTKAEDQQAASRDIFKGQAFPISSGIAQEGKENGTGKKIIIGLLALLMVAGGLWGWCIRGAGGGVQAKLDLAVKYLSENKYKEAILAYNDAIKIDSKNMKAYQGLARAYTLQGCFQEAGTVYKAGLAAVAPGDRLQLHLAQAGLYIDRGDMDKAEAAFKEIIAENKNCVEGYRGLAAVYQRLGDTEKARLALEQGVRENLSDYGAYNALSRFWAGVGNSEKALEYLVRSLDLEVNQQEAYAILEQLFKGKWDELINEADSLSGSNTAAMLKFYAYYAERRHLQALSLYQGNLDQDKNNLKARALAAVCLASGGSMAEAGQLITGLEQAKANGWIMADIAEYYRLTGEKDNALTWAGKSLDENPGNYQALLLLAELSKGTGRENMARLYLARVMVAGLLPVDQIRVELKQKGIELPEFILRPQQTAYIGESIGEKATDKKIPSQPWEDWHPARGNGKWGFKDENNNVVIPFQYDSAWPFTEGLARVEVNGMWGFIDSTGNFAVPPRYQRVFDFSEGLAAAKDSDLWGFIDRTGKMVIPPQYLHATWFSSNGLAPVQVRDMNGKLIEGYINKSGQFIIEPRFEAAGCFSEGLAPVVINGKLGYIDYTGNVVIAPRFDRGELTVFTNGMAPVKLQGKTGYINRAGDIVVDARFDKGEYFRNGLAAVQIGGKWGYVDRTGVLVIQPQYDEAHSFSASGKAWVEMGGKSMTIDRSGRVIK